MQFQMIKWLLIWEINGACAGPGYGAEAKTIGINYGTLGNNLPTPAAAVGAIQGMKIGRVKIFNPNAGILAALANSGLEAVVAIPNDQIGAIGAAQSAADAWIAANVAPYYPATNIVTILVGNEVPLLTPIKFLRVVQINKNTNLCGGGVVKMPVRPTLDDVSIGVA